ncbi:hypothetical protein AUC43_15295 [Hymenobacter sedentarius]|uniref:Uncharacterized protein n=1 Tax=Hymenobacter sedentarius TaxID=1411621 RepID=A0A0U4C7S1_9BACT|nr:hypothetical protein [Hymenobacter sedentarius]ALW86328.1 hypothetical protein AUC43_15295 [Hymenobacter sedentarius]
MTKTVIALTTFLSNRELWLPGERKEVSQHLADELLKAGLVAEAGGTEVTQVAEVPPTKRSTKPKRLKLETK